jgi:hypothetical protein
LKAVASPWLKLGVFFSWGWRPSSTFVCASERAR